MVIFCRFFNEPIFVVEGNYIPAWHIMAYPLSIHDLVLPNVPRSFTDDHLEESAREPELRPIHPVEYSILAPIGGGLKPFRHVRLYSTSKLGIKISRIINELAKLA